MRKFSLLALCACLVLPLAAAADDLPLVDPEPIMVPQGASLDVVSAAVMHGLEARKWKWLPSSTAGVVHANIIARGGDEASVDIIYDTTKVQIHYMGSRNMDEQEVNGQRTISSRYINWSRNLAQSIGQELGVVPR